MLPNSLFSTSEYFVQTLISLLRSHKFALTVHLIVSAVIYLCLIDATNTSILASLGILSKFVKSTGNLASEDLSYSSSFRRVSTSMFYSRFTWTTSELNSSSVIEVQYLLEVGAVELKASKFDDTSYAYNIVLDTIFYFFLPILVRSLFAKRHSYVN